jgi:hypothetical protein
MRFPDLTRPPASRADKLTRDYWDAAVANAKIHAEVMPRTAARSRTSNGVPQPSGISQAYHMKVTVTQMLRRAASIDSQMRRNAGSPSINGRTKFPNSVG